MMSQFGYAVGDDGRLIGEILLDDGVNSISRPDVVSVTPPDHVDGFVSMWDGAAWVCVPLPDATPALEAVKLARWAVLKQARDAAEVEPVQVGSMLFDVDDRSLQRRSMALEIASDYGPGWSEVWTLADNSMAVVTEADLRQITAALAVRTRDLHQVGRALRAQIMAATTVEQVQSVVWPLP